MLINILHKHNLNTHMLAYILVWRQSSGVLTSFITILIRQKSAVYIWIQYNLFIMNRELYKCVCYNWHLFYWININYLTFFLWRDWIYNNKVLFLQNFNLLCGRTEYEWTLLYTHNTTQAATTAFVSCSVVNHYSGKCYEFLSQKLFSFSIDKLLV